jgi:hypothetical protein
MKPSLFLTFAIVLLSLSGASSLSFDALVRLTNCVGGLMNYYNNYHHQQQLSLVDTMNQPKYRRRHTQQQLVAHDELDSVITNLHFDKVHWREQASQCTAEQFEDCDDKTNYEELIWHMMKKIEELEEESKISKDELRRLKEKLEDLALITQRASQDSQPVSWWASAWLLWAWMW